MKRYLHILIALEIWDVLEKAFYNESDELHVFS